MKNRFWRVLVKRSRIKRFRSQFLGGNAARCIFSGAVAISRSPVFRDSLRSAPRRDPHLPDAITREAYSQEVSSLGFWPGNDMLPQPIFYSYAYPEPKGFAEAEVKPGAASYNAQFKEFILPYDVVREADSPDDVLLDFAQSTYEAASILGKWDRAALIEQKPDLLSPRQPS